MARWHLFVLLITCLLMQTLHAQEDASRTDKLLSLPVNFLKKVNKRSQQLEDKLLTKSDKVLDQLAKEEKRLRKKLARKDPALAKKVFADAQGQYQSLQSKLTSKVSAVEAKGDYFPYMDTLTTSLRFLQNKPALLNNSAVQQSIDRLKSMEGRFQQATEIEQYLRTRREYLKQQFTQLNMVKALKNYSKKAYYYQAQVTEYKELLKQPDKISRKAIDLLCQTKPYRDFISKYSVLGSLFPTNIPAATPGVVPPGLQTNAQVASLMQQPAGGGNGFQSLQAGMQQAKAQLDELKNKLNAKGKSGSEEMPNFKPNNQRVKSFWQRWEVGTNMQSTKSTNWLPAATQLGLSAGYKLNDRSVIGVGMAGSMGWGRNIRNISITYEGVSARSYVDWKLRGAIWLSAGYEMNYRSTFTRMAQLKMLNAWQRSGLVGLSKKYQVSKKFKGNMSLLWDYLSYNQLPRTQPLIFRFGYSLK